MLIRPPNSKDSDLIKHLQDLDKQVTNGGFNLQTTGPKLSPSRGQMSMVLQFRAVKPTQYEGYGFNNVADWYKCKFRFYSSLAIVLNPIFYQ